MRFEAVPAEFLKIQVSLRLQAVSTSEQLPMMKKRIAYILRVNQSSVTICVYQLTYRTVVEDWNLKIHSPQLNTSNTRNFHFSRRSRDLVLHLHTKEKDFILVYFNI